MDMRRNNRISFFNFPPFTYFFFYFDKQMPAVSWEEILPKMSFLENADVLFWSFRKTVIFSQVHRQFRGQK